MGILIKRTPKITTALCIAFLALSAAVGSADVLPTAEDINSLSRRANLAAAAFAADSFELRMKYEYGGAFLKQEDEENLRKIAQKASGNLGAIAENQKHLKQQIEDYQGDDWDSRYGSTGLWRKLSTDLYKTRLSKCQIGFYLALASDQPKRDTRLHNVLTEIDSLNLPRLPAKSQLLKAKTLAILGRTSPTYKPPAKREFDALMERSDMAHSTVFTIAMERIKLLGEPQPGRLEQMTKNIAQSSCADDFELILSLAFLQRRYDSEAFEKTVQLFPQTEDFIGSLILSDISSSKTRDISVFEAELAVQTAWKNKAQNHKIVLSHLVEIEKFQTPLILYVTAVALADSSPARAVNLLKKASSLQQLQKSDRLNIEPDKIADQAARLAYNLFVEDLNNCPLAIEAFENYITIAQQKIDEELGYLYSTILNNCGRPGKATELLEKIADTPTHSWRSRAKLELITGTIRQKQYENPQHKIRLALQFSDLITDNNDCQYADEAMVLLGEIIDQIETCQKETEQFSAIIQACKKLARFCCGCLEGPQYRQGSLYLAEVSVFAADKDSEKLSEVEKLLSNLAEDGNDVDLVRCRARLLIGQGEFEEAGRLWSQICQVRKNETASATRRSWKWWRAKYYQLYCWAECAGTQNKDVLHTIEVLENSFTNIPPLWAEKFGFLKEKMK